MKTTDESRRELREKAATVDVNAISEEQWREIIEKILKIGEKTSNRHLNVTNEVGSST